MPDRVLGGRYIIQDKIGTGGMAIVYRGLDNRLGRSVAIKTMLPQYASDPSFAARFKQEAQAAAALQSPYIVSVYDWGKDADTYYIAMEYLRGTDLKSGVRKHGALDCKKVAQIGSQIAQALSVAHRHDIIHRDIKPQNIMVQPDGNIKVMDFGIARAKNSHLTTDNSVLGTAHYVSPEQTQGKPLGPTTDIYSLGIVMYEAATGVVPFDGDDAIAVALKQVNEEPIPPSQRNPKVDSALEGIILKCMQKDARARFQTADELARVLRDYLAGKRTQVSAATNVLPYMTPAAEAPSLASTRALPHLAPTGRATMPQMQPRARELAAENERKHKGKVVGMAILGALVLVALVVAVVGFFGSQGATKDVPNLLGLSQQDALMAIDNSGFFQRGTVKEEYSSTVEKGKVLDQDPDAGKKATKGTQINIVVSKGQEPAADVVVPDLTGKTPSEAEAILSKLGLKSQAGDSIYSSDVEVGKIAAQTPAAKSPAKAGDVITYQLSKGAEEVDVPNVVGKSEADATSALEKAGFKVTSNKVESSQAEGTVTKQSASGKAAKNSTITIYVAKKAEDVDISRYVSKGDSLSSAKQALENQGFKVNVRRVDSSSAAKDTVISFTERAKPGKTVTLTVSNGSKGDQSTSSN